MLSHTLPIINSEVFNIVSEAIVRVKMGGQHKKFTRGPWVEISAIHNPALLELHVLDGQSVVRVTDVDVLVWCLEDAGVAELLGGDDTGLNVPGVGPREPSIHGEGNTERNTALVGGVIDQKEVAIIENMCLPHAEEEEGTDTDMTSTPQCIPGWPHCCWKTEWLVGLTRCTL